MFHGDFNECSMNVFGHVGLVAANVEICAVFKPFPNVSTVFFEAMFDVNLLFLVTRPCSCEFVQISAVHPAFNLFLVVKFSLLGLITEEQPVTTVATVENTLLHERSELSDTGARPHHDNIHILVLRKDE